MSAIRITLEITSLAQANALTRALDLFVSCESERLADERKIHANAKQEGLPVDWRDAQDVRDLAECIDAARALLKSIE